MGTLCKNIVSGSYYSCLIYDRIEYSILIDIKKIVPILLDLIVTEYKFSI